jgi:hypothetical protein
LGGDVVGRILVLVAFALGLISQSAVAQENTADQFAERDASFGPGCNSIGLARSAIDVEGLIALSDSWLDEHSGCVGNELTAWAICEPEHDGGRQYEFCAFVVEQSSGETEVTCDNFRLFSDHGIIRPHGDMSAATAANLEDYLRQNDVLVAEREVSVAPCDRPTVLVEGQAINLVFELEPTTQKLVLWMHLGLLDEEPMQVVAFVIDHST